jgi:hypothetical protein
LTLTVSNLSSTAHNRQPSSNLSVGLQVAASNKLDHYHHTASTTTMSRTIYPPIFKATFRIREAYGNIRAYPVSREAVLLCQLTGNKTLRAQEISTIRELGFECLDTDGHVINAVDLY